jgi:hypothetical protein
MAALPALRRVGESDRLQHRAGVAEWQTRRTQNPLVARPCGFDSLLRHVSLAGLQIVLRLRRRILFFR